MMYTLQDAVAIAKQLEAPVYARFGLHIAIGGSCVYRGTSEKDVDIFLYPHARDVQIDRVQIMAWLTEQGFPPRETLDDDHTQVPDVLVPRTAAGVKVDFFFLERHTVLVKADEQQVTGLPPEFLKGSPFDPPRYQSLDE